MGTATVPLLLTHPEWNRLQWAWGVRCAWAWLCHRLVMGLFPSPGSPGHLGTYWKVASHLYKC